MENDLNQELPSPATPTRLSFSPESEEFWHSLPSGPGIYIFEDENKKPLYIGKSINLKTRFKQHYEGFVDGSTKALQFIPKTRSLYFRPVRNDIEAVIVEANYIKSYKPRYNSIVKDDRSNIYLIFTNPPDTKIALVRATDITSLGLEDYKTQLYGPYTSSLVANTLVKQMRRIFGFCLAPFNARNRACFNYHIGHCPGACVAEMNRKEYLTHMGRLKKFLSGNFVMLDRSLHREIKKSIRSEDFEKAQDFKMQIFGLHHTLSTKNSSLLLKLSDATDALQTQIVKKLKHPKLYKPPVRIECYDLAHLQSENYVGAMAVFINGTASQTDYRHFNIHLPDRSDPHAMKQIISRRLKHSEWGSPDLIILDGGVPQLSIVSKVIPYEIPVIALAKKRETIYYLDESGKTVAIQLSIEDPVLNLFRNIRDEAHRLANSFHKKKRQIDLIK